MREMSRKHFNNLIFKILKKCNRDCKILVANNRFTFIDEDGETAVFHSYDFDEMADENTDDIQTIDKPGSMFHGYWLSDFIDIDKFRQLLRAEI